MEFFSSDASRVKNENEKNVKNERRKSSTTMKTQEEEE